MADHEPAGDDHGAPPSDPPSHRWESDDLRHPVVRLRRTLAAGRQGSPTPRQRGEALETDGPGRDRAGAAGDSAVETAGRRGEVGLTSAAEAVDTPRGRAGTDAVTPHGRPRWAVAAVLGVAAAVAVASGAAALLTRGGASTAVSPPPAVPGPNLVPPLPTTSPSSTPAPGDVIGNLRMFTTSTGWAERALDGAILHTTQGVDGWLVASPPLAGWHPIAVAFLSADTARVLSAPAVGAASASGDATAQEVDCWATADGGVSWNRMGTIVVPLPPEPEYESLDFVDAEHGWWSLMPGGSGETSHLYLYRTSDGGAHWSEVARAPGTAAGSGGPATATIPGGCDTNGVVFVNATTGWLTGTCGDLDDYFYVSHDGGATWTGQALPRTGSTGIPVTTPPRFSSPSDGVMVAEIVGSIFQSAFLYVTTDGGSTWTVHPTPANQEQSVDFVDPDDGWLLMLNQEEVANGVGESVLYATHDGGRSWAPLPGSEPVGTDVGSLAGLELDFLNSEVGWAAPLLEGPGMPTLSDELIQTSDGGSTWAVEVPQIS